jgi:protein-tyrosine phosphatase
MVPLTSPTASVEIDPPTHHHWQALYLDVNSLDVKLVMWHALIMVANDRRVPGVVELEGALNAREVGGHVTADQRRLVRRTVYRSSALNHLTALDVQQVSDLRIATVIDLRSPDEAARAPDRLAAGATCVNAPIIADALDQDRLDQLLAVQGFSAGMYDRDAVSKHGPFYRMLTLVNSYGDRRFVEKLSAYKPVFDTLRRLPERSAALIHCTGGRDRTGIAVALLLKMLGVTQKQIETDYLASNQLLQPCPNDPDSTAFKRFEFSNVYIQPTNNREFQRIATSLGESPQHIYDAIKLRPELLHTLFTAIDITYGSFQLFLAKGLGLSDQDVQEIREKYTEA